MLRGLGLTMAMSRESARALLGVDESASEAEIQRAFRDKAKAAHPDHGGAGGDLGRLAEARDVVSQPAPQTSEQPSEPRVSAASAPRPASAPVSDLAVDDLDRRAGCGLVGVLSIIAIGGIGIVFAGVLVFGFVVSGNRSDRRPERQLPADCIRIMAQQQDVERVTCDAPNAQRIELTYDLTATAAPCPTGANTLDTVTTRWCLRPVAP